MATWALALPPLALIARAAETPRTRQEIHMDYQQLGSHGPQVSAIGLGTMGMSDMYGPVDRAESIATIHAALDAGVTLLDTGDFYGMGHNEMLLGEALKGRNRQQVQISVKFGALRGPARGEFNGYDSRPAAVRNFIGYSLQRLGVEYIDIYRPARLDPGVPIEETIGAIANLIKQGHVRYIGLSEVGAQTIRRAQAVHPIADLQIEYSLISRGIEREIIPTCRELGVGITAYGVLSRGLISGHWQKDSDKGDFRSRAPRFQGANLETNLALVERLRAVASAIGASVAQVAIAWVIARAATQQASIVPLIGARRRDRLAESLGALDIRLSPDQIQEIERAVPAEAAAGERYPQAQLAHMDSERS
jgi:aryl-alcohol dehydrogenase-like predicted oxidoreductase